MECLPNIISSIKCIITGRYVIFPKKYLLNEAALELERDILNWIKCIAFILRKVFSTKVYAI